MYILLYIVKFVDYQLFLFSYHNLILILDEDTPCESVSNGYCIRDASNCAGASFPLPTSIPIFECCSEEFTYCCVPLPVQLRR